MKTIVKLLNLGLVIILLSSSSCKRQEIPDDAHFYCYIDGKLFVPKGSSNITTTPSDTGLSYLIYDDYFRAEATDHKKYVVMFNITKWGVGTYKLSESDNYYNKGINQAMANVNKTWYISKNNSGTVTFLEVNSRGNVKGTFEFTLYNENDDSDTIHITGGYFEE